MDTLTYVTPSVSNKDIKYSKFSEKFNDILATSLHHEFPKISKTTIKSTIRNIIVLIVNQFPNMSDEGYESIMSKKVSEKARDLLEFISNRNPNLSNYGDYVEKIAEIKDSIKQESHASTTGFNFKNRRNFLKITCI